MVPEDVPFGESPISPDWGIINVLSQIVRRQPNQSLG